MNLDQIVRDFAVAMEAVDHRYPQASTTAASSSDDPSVMNRVTVWPDPYRCLISAMRSPVLTGSPSGEVVKSQYHKASRDTRLHPGK